MDKCGTVQSIDREDIDCDTCFKKQVILNDEIDDPESLEFAIENLMSYFPISLMEI